MGVVYGEFGRRSQDAFDSAVFAQELRLEGHPFDAHLWMDAARKQQLADGVPPSMVNAFFAQAQLRVEEMYPSEVFQSVAYVNNRFVGLDLWPTDRPTEAVDIHLLFGEGIIAGCAELDIKDE